MASNAISAQGSKLSIESATPGTYTQIKELKSFSGFDGKAGEIDVTTLDSEAKEFKKGLRDNGNFGFDLNRVYTDAGQILLDAAQADPDPAKFKLELPNGKTAMFDALVLSFNLTGQVDGILSSSASLRISGSVTWA